MNSYTTVTLLPTTVYGTASGNYDGSSADFYGNSLPAANYYNGQGNLQTIGYRLSGFVGIATVEATLQDAPDQSHWFEIDHYGNGVDPYTDYHTVSVIGNFAHLRVHITNFEAGTITSITAAY